MCTFISRSLDMHEGTMKVVMGYIIGYITLAMYGAFHRENLKYRDSKYENKYIKTNVYVGFRVLTH